MALYRSLIRIFSGQARLGRSLIDKGSRTIRGALGSDAIRNYDPIEAMRSMALVNDYIVQNNELCMFATIIFGVLDPRKGTMVYINGGHQTAYVLNQNGIKDSLSPTGPAVGVIPGVQFQYKETLLNPGDMLITYSDGVIDALSANEERFTEQRLKSLLSQSGQTVSQLMQRIRTDLFDHIGQAQQEDDITILALQREPA